ncbi:FusB/FusC family EF-G-binding protein [Fictibacillus phosphorivorans]|uniref:FusB/FusC family EF-G-binding protein n=1 Tax=Fictibacillus phosphorivorans TaxID=1221500 RepID=UPI00203AA816|nr:FusB/FusC family EF-G-binding protein [Fictibacillus phosphorivorans]MCM3718164.1 FusB/FusC family EF-G-binding protein [Fictibacillus phosphorivorans]MCM3775791.1 FusB/FusC family EF-G-binding protein [Fictibacillus phosphorivorans]
MQTPFIRNHQYNLIKKLVGKLQHACNNGADPKVIEAVEFSALTAILDSFPELTHSQKEMVEKFVGMRKSEEFQQYFLSLESYLEAFSEVTGKQLMKLFPKIKKLKTPNLSAVDLHKISYLGWVDIATQKLFIVYHLNGKTVGIQGRYTPASKGVCFLCNGIGDVALFSAVTKSKPANASSDYYKAIGNYMCVDSHTCNKKITDVTVLEKFLHDVLH